MSRPFVRGGRATPLPQLRPYQLEIGRAVFESVRHRRGLTFTVEIARQGGKNELSAQLELLLLTLHMVRGGSSVKCAPTFVPQAAISIDRLKARLRDAGYDGHWHTRHGAVIELGRARQAFYSADGAANVVGATASLLLEVDEAQDVDAEVYQKSFRPMGASGNATTVLWGTPWHGETLLEQQKQVNLALEREDGVRRHFRFDWRAVAASNWHYARYVEAEAQRLGEDHPLFRTQYLLEPLTGGRGFLSPQQRAWLQGEHARAHLAAPGVVHVAGIDIAGEAAGGDAESADHAVRGNQPQRDSTVVTVAALDYAATEPLSPDPVIRVVDHVWWTGRSHASLVPDLAALLRDTWGCRSIVVDATGLGQGVASMLARLLGPRVQPFVFTAESKSRLGFGLLGAVNGNRLKLYGNDESTEWRECWRQIDRTQLAYRPNRQMNFFVPEKEGHDDFVMSLALAVEAARAYTPRSARGRLRTDEYVGYTT